MRYVITAHIIYFSSTIIIQRTAGVRTNRGGSPSDRRTIADFYMGRVARNEIIALAMEWKSFFVSSGAVMTIHVYRLICVFAKSLSYRSGTGIPIAEKISGRTKRSTPRCSCDVRPVGSTMTDGRNARPKRTYVQKYVTYTTRRVHGNMISGIITLCEHRLCFRLFTGI